MQLHRSQCSRRHLRCRVYGVDALQRALHSYGLSVHVLHVARVELLNGIVHDVSACRCA
jgi:hypothetical protein